MRRKEQLSLVQPWIEHPHARELEMIGRILDQEPGIAARVEQELVRGVKNPHLGRSGMTGDQVVRVMVIKQLREFSYEELAFHLMDSASYRTFCGFSFLEPLPSRSALAENLKKVEQAALEAANRLVVKHAEKKKVEDGKKVRIDSTGVEANIHDPSDSTLLYDGVRVLAHLLRKARKLAGFRSWRDYERSAKRSMRAISDARKPEQRTALYEQLLVVSRRTLGYAEAGAKALEGKEGRQVERVRTRLAHFAALLTRVIDQTERRVLKGEKVPAEEKLSYLKRVFGLSRCTWRGEASFASYVWSSVLAANLLTLARHLLG